MYFYVSVELDQSIKTAENLSKAFKAMNIYSKFSFDKSKDFANISKSAKNKTAKVY
jgi:hypothetical protein